MKVKVEGTNLQLLVAETIAGLMFLWACALSTAENELMREKIDDVYWDTIETLSAIRD